MAKFKIIHKTQYEYEEPVSHCHNVGHLKPTHADFQKLISNQIHVNPTPTVQQERTDYFGNQYLYFSIEEPHKKIEVTSTSQVAVEDPAYKNFEGALSMAAALQALQECSNPADLQAVEFCFDSRFIKTSAAIRDFGRMFFSAERSLLSAALDMTCYIRENFEYDPRATNIMTPLADILQNKKGVCQDFTHLCIAALRSLGLPARYISGYIETLPAPGKEKLRGADATHAWFATYSPDVGWVDFDPTNGKFMTDEYITTAIGRDFADVTPLKGVLFGGGKHRLKVAVDVERL